MLQPGPTGSTHGKSSIHPSPVRHLIREPRHFLSLLWRFRADRAVPTRVDPAPTGLDRWSGAIAPGRQCRSLLLTLCPTERVDDRRLPVTLGIDQYTPDLLQPPQLRRMVRLLRGPDFGSGRIPPVRHVASTVGRITATDSRGPHRARGTNPVWPHLHFLRWLALRLRPLHSEHGAQLATRSPWTRLPHRACPRYSRIWHRRRRPAPPGSHSRSNHDEPVRPAGLDAELFRTASPLMGDAATESMVRARREPGVGRCRVDCRDVLGRPPLDLRLATTRMIDPKRQAGIAAGSARCRQPSR